MPLQTCCLSSFLSLESIYTPCGGLAVRRELCRALQSGGQLHSLWGTGRQERTLKSSAVWRAATLLVGDWQSGENCAELCSLERRYTPCGGLAGRRELGRALQSGEQIHSLWGTGSQERTLHSSALWRAATLLVGDWHAGENSAELCSLEGSYTPCGELTGRRELCRALQSGE